MVVQLSSLNRYFSFHVKCGVSSFTKGISHDVERMRLYVVVLKSFIDIQVNRRSLVGNLGSINKDDGRVDKNEYLI